MLKMVQRGDYKLFDAKENKKVLLIDDMPFVWENAVLRKDLSPDSEHDKTILASGKYRLYEVANEPGFSDMFHLELSVGCGNWQGWLLNNSLPVNKDNHTNTAPTKEIITKTNSCSECKCGC